MILIFSGAGISKASGIDTFLEQPDLRDKLHRHYASHHPNEYIAAIKFLIETSNKAKPNDAHIAIAEYGIPVITMNIDGLHERAGSDVVALHGTLPAMKDLNIADKLRNQPVLYGDAAPNYEIAFNMISKLGHKDLLIVVGASSYTQIADHLRQLAASQGVKIIEIQSHAETEVRKIIEKNIDYLKEG